MESSLVLVVSETFSSCRQHSIFSSSEFPKVHFKFNTFFHQTFIFSLFPLLFNSFLAITRKALLFFCFYPPLSTSKPLSEGSIIGRSKRFTLSPISSSTGIANPLNSKSKQDAKFHFLILIHEDPDCSFCPINLGYALAAETLKAVFWGIKMNISRNRLFHQFCHHVPTDASCSVPCHWEKVVLWQNAIKSIITVTKK